MQEVPPGRLMLEQDVVLAFQQQESSIGNPVGQLPTGLQRNDVVATGMGYEGWDPNLGEQARNIDRRERILEPDCILR